MTSKVKSMILIVSIGSFWFFFIMMHYFFGNTSMSFWNYVQWDIFTNNIGITLAAMTASIISLLFMFLGYQLVPNNDNNFYDEILNRSNDAIFFIDVETGLITYANNQVSSNLGVDLQEISAKTFADIDPIAKKNKWQDYVNEIREKGPLRYETTYRGDNGKDFPVEVNISFVMKKERPILSAIIRNIAERKQAQEWHQSIIRTANDAFFMSDAKGQFLEVNDAFCHMTGRRQKELLQLGIGEVFDSPKEVEDKLFKIFIAGTGTFNCGIRSRNGALIHLEVSANYLASDGGRYFAFLRDITERKEMQEVLSAEKERLAVTLRSIGDGVIATDTKGRIILMNSVAEKISGWTQEEALTMPVSEVLQVIEEKSEKRCENPVAQVLLTGKSAPLPPGSVLITKNNAKRTVEMTGSPIIDQNGQTIGVVLVFQDKTTERQTEKELQKIEKLTSLSMLAGGIAHDFNNILGVILGNISLAKVLLDKGGKDMMPALEEAEEASLRAKDLSRQLLTFARGGSPVKELANIAPVIKESAKFACTGSPVRCQINLPQDIWPTEIDPGQMSQVIQNLVINAIQAMPEGGVVRIDGENVRLDGEAKSNLPLSPGKYIRISVKDQGVGIWPDQLAKIFDPYFTTKEQGSGLGLSTVYSTLKNHGGYIAVDSTPSQGTTFTFYLPAYKMEASRQEQPQGPLHKGKGKVLVIDDEAMIRTNMRQILDFLGYSADLTEDGAKALELYKNAKEAGEPYEAVITDLTIPGGMGGKETIKKLQELDPQVKAIVFSGSADSPILNSHADFGFKGSIKKPYTINDVSDSLHQVISENLSAETPTV